MAKTGGSAVGSASALGAEGREFESRPPDFSRRFQGSLREDRFVIRRRELGLAIGNLFWSRRLKQEPILPKVALLLERICFLSVAFKNEALLLFASIAGLRKHNSGIFSSSYSFLDKVIRRESPSAEKFKIYAPDGMDILSAHSTQSILGEGAISSKSKASNCSEESNLYASTCTNDPPLGIL